MMSISKLASTVILATSFATIFLFAFIFYLFGGKDGALKEVLSMTASFFGGIATLVAAYIATQLFNDWKDQEKYRITSSLALDCLKDYLAAKDMLFFYLFQHVYNTPAITYKDLDDFFFQTNHKITTLNEILGRLKKAEIDKEIVDSFYMKNYLEIAKYISSTEMLKQYSNNELKDYHEKFINNEKMKLLPHKLLDILKID